MDRIEKVDEGQEQGSVGERLEFPKASFGLKPECC